MKKWKRRPDFKKFYFSLVTFRRKTNSNFTSYYFFKNYFLFVKLNVDSQQNIRTDFERAFTTVVFVTIILVLKVVKEIGNSDLLGKNAGLRKVGICVTHDSGFHFFVLFLTRSLI